METKYGTKYKSKKDVKEIAKDIRKDIKAELPEVKVSVKIERFAGGRSIDVDIKKLPNESEIINPEYNFEEPNGQSRYTKKGQGLLDKVQAIVDAYNFDGSDTQSDYFHVNFYGHVNIDYDYEQELRGLAKK